MVPSGKSKRVLFHIVYIIKVYSKTVLPVPVFMFFLKYRTGTVPFLQR